MLTEKVHNTPLVSVIVAAYNAEAFIAECLESIIAQTYDNIEIIVVDDGSRDNTAEVVQKYHEHVRYFHQEPSGGPAAPRNKGILHSRGEYLLFFDSDDILILDCISRQVDFLQRHTDVGMIFCDYRNFDENHSWEKTHFENCPQIWSIINSNSDHSDLVLDKAFRVLAKENFGIMGGLMIRRSMLKYGPTFNENLKSCEDFFFYYRLARYTPVGINTNVGYMRRLHATNITTDKYKMLTMGILSRTLLRQSEMDKQAKDLLGESIASRWSSLSRYNANHGKFYQSYRSELTALSENFCISGLYKALKSFLRTTLMAMGVHDPHEV